MSIKDQSKKLQLLLKNYGHNLKYSHALEVMSKMNNDKNWHISSNRNSNYIETGFKKLDKDLGGGLLKKSSSIVVGKAHTGVSTLLISLICNALRKKRKVLFYNLDSLDKAKTLIISNLTNISFYRLKKGFEHKDSDLTDEEIKRIKKVQLNILKHYLVIVNVPDVVSFSDMKNSIIERKSDFDFDLLVVDYIERIKENDYHCYSELKLLAKAFNCSSLSLSYARKTKDKINSSHINFTFEDYNIFCLHEMNKEYELEVINNKQSKNKNTYQLNPDFETFNILKG